MKASLKYFPVRLLFRFKQKYKATEVSYSLRTYNIKRNLGGSIKGSSLKEKKDKFLTI